MDEARSRRIEEIFHTIADEDAAATVDARAAGRTSEAEARLRNTTTATASRTHER